MAAPILLRTDYDGVSLRRIAKASTDANQTRRLLAVAEICDGGARWEGARIGGVGLQVIRDWVLGFNTDGPQGLSQTKISAIFQSPFGCGKSQVFCVIHEMPGITIST